MLFKQTITGFDKLKLSKIPVFNTAEKMNIFYCKMAQNQSLQI